MQTITLSPTGIGLIVITISTGIAITISNKVLIETAMQKYNKYKKQYQKNQQTFICFDKLFRNFLQDI